jgi:glycosyltransferase involved in cell wall biosynthesis
VAEEGVLGSVVIPAWNESGSIATTLDALFDGVDPGSFEAVVACNGCTDDTVERARNSAAPVVVLDLPPIGKARAIREAESVVSALPRLYLDADVTLPGRSAHAVLVALNSGAVAARPPARFDSEGASTLVRSFYRQRSRLTAVMSELYGAGVYGLSATARARFGVFPDVIADDLFAARVVDASEVCIVDCDPVTVTVPRDVRSLVRTLARAHRGNRQLRSIMPDSVTATAHSTAGGIARSIRTPGQAADALVYALVAVTARVWSLRPTTSWGRDDSTRVMHGGESGERPISGRGS